VVVKWASRRMDRPNPRPLAQGRDGGISSAILPAHPASLKFDATAASGVILEKWLNFRNSHSGAIRKPSLLWAGLVRTREWSSCRLYVCTQGPKMLGLDGVMRISSG
jgi:hypothetical protein